MRLCQDDPEAAALLESVRNAKRYVPADLFSEGTDQDAESDLNNVKIIESPMGNSNQYALRRLRRESEKSPEVAALRERVLAGVIQRRFVRSCHTTSTAVRIIGPRFDPAGIGEKAPGGE